VVSKKPTLQLSAASGSGNSGGPVLNAKGEVIGIVRANIGGQSTFTFAVPAESVLAALSDAKTATLKDPGGSAGGSVGGSGNRFVNLAISAVAFAALAVFYWRVRKR
jgi:S1-C subfamily serine protease